MGVKAEIGWKTRTDEGGSREVCVSHVGKKWRFRVREKRFETWEPLERPTLEDLGMMLDAVRRRIQRRLLRPEMEAMVLKLMREHYPDAMSGGEGDNPALAEPGPDGTDRGGAQPLKGRVR